jgi:CYTH domain-containing protein
MNPATALKALREAETRLARVRLIIRYKRAEKAVQWRKTAQDRAELEAPIKLEDDAQAIENVIQYIHERIAG